MQAVTEPRQPAAQKMIALAGAELAVASRPQGAPMCLENLHGAVRPAETLSYVAGKGMGRETSAEHFVDVNRFVALRQQAQAQLRVLADAPLRPALHLVQCRLAEQCHGAVLDDGDAFVAMHHADVEEAGVFPVDHFLEAIAFPAAMVLRRLHEGDFAVFEMRREALQPVAPHQIITVDHTDDFRIGGGLLKRENERAGQEAVTIAERENAETRAELSSMIGLG